MSPTPIHLKARDVAGLLARVEGATSGDQWKLLHETKRLLLPLSDDTKWLWTRLAGLLDAGGYESAALALIERALPEANCVGFDKTPHEIDGYVSRNCVPSGHWLHEGRAKTPALALLAALLRALSKTEETSNG